jgi:uncharacterized protein YegL
MATPKDLTTLPTQVFNLNGDKQIQQEIKNIKIAKDDYDFKIKSMNSFTDTNIIEKIANKLRFAQLRYAILFELKSQNLQLSNATNKIFYPTEDATCDVCYEELIDIEGKNHNWKVRTCGHVGCNDPGCASNSIVNGLGKQHTVSGQSNSCSICRQTVRGIFQGGNNVKRARNTSTPLRRTLTSAINYQMTQNYTDDNYEEFERFIPEQVTIRVNIITSDIDQKIENLCRKTEQDDIIPFKSYLAIINNVEHPSTAVLATEVIDKIQVQLSQGIVFIIDISGSMKSEIENIKKTLINYIESMSINDYYSLIVFDDKAYTIISYEKATIENKTKWIYLINKITDCGGTSYTAAINELINLLNEINQISPSLFSRTRIIIMGDGDGDMDCTILQRLHNSNINIYGITIGNQVNVETIKIVIGQVSFDQGNYRHYDNNNLFDLITSMDLLATTFIKDIKIIVKNAKIDASNVIINNDGNSELIYKYHGPGVKRLRLTDMKLETQIIISYGENITSQYITIPGDQVILTQFCSYRKIGKEILKCTNMKEIDEIITSISEEKFGEHTEMITKLANTKKQQINPDLYPNITTPIQYSQNYTQNTIAAISATSSTPLNRAKSGI